MTVHGISPGLLPLTPAELILIFAELSATRRVRDGSIDGEPTELQQCEDELYTLLLERLRSAAAVTEVKISELPIR